MWWAALQMRKPSKGLCSSTAVLLAGLSANALAIPTVSTVAPSLVAEGKVVGQGSQPETSVFCNASTLPLYVINLDNRASKLRTFAERLPSPLSACRVTGVNGDALPFSLPSDLISSLEWRSAQLRTTLRLPIMGTFLTKGAVGLTLAHARAWAHMLERGDEMALIAEDDLYFYVPNAIEQIEGACETARLWSPKQILLQFCRGTNTTAGEWPKPSHGQENYTDAQVMWTRTGAKLTKASLLPITTESCQGFYLLTREGARIMLNSLFPIVNQIDAGIQPLRVRVHAAAAARAGGLWAASLSQTNALPLGCPLRAPCHWCRTGRPRLHAHHSEMFSLGGVARPSPISADHSRAGRRGHFQYKYIFVVALYVVAFLGRCSCARVGDARTVPSHCSGRRTHRLLRCAAGIQLCGTRPRHRGRRLKHRSLWWPRLVGYFGQQHAAPRLFPGAYRQVVIEIIPAHECRALLLICSSRLCKILHIELPPF